MNRRRTNSRLSISSTTNFLRNQPLSSLNPLIRANRSTSRVSFLSTNTNAQLENAKLLKPIPQGSLESLAESSQSGNHVEFKLSVQLDETKHEHAQTSTEHKGSHSMICTHYFDLF